MNHLHGPRARLQNFSPIYAILREIQGKIQSYKLLYSIDIYSFYLASILVRLWLTRPIPEWQSLSQLMQMKPVLSPLSTYPCLLSLWRQILGMSQNKKIYVWWCSFVINHSINVCKSDVNCYLNEARVLLVQFLYLLISLNPDGAVIVCSHADQIRYDL